jgi:membrane protein DedA with SNARE-associated domain
MLDLTADLPLAQAIVILFLGAFVRGNATYWVGRGVFGGVARTRFARHVQGPTMQRAERFMARWGVLAVPLSFLTIGIQTAVNLTAGVTRVPLVRYLPAVTVGALMWGVLYATVGLAAFYAAAALAVRSPWAAGAVVLTSLVLLWVVRRRHRPEVTVGAAD